MPKTIQSINPFTEEVNAEFELLTEEQILAKIKIADTAYHSWKEVSLDERKALCLKLADVVESKQEELAKMQTLEMWMLYSESFPWMAYSSKMIRWCADNAEKVLSDEEFDYGEETKWRYRYEPIGVLYWVAPWNFPFNQVLRAAVPNILAWNVQIYKHASNVPMAWEMLEKLFLEAGFPEWVYQNIIISWRDSEFILSQREVVWLNLTGWENAWRVLGALAGKNLKPSVLELGGNDVFIVAKNSNLDEITDWAVRGRMRNGWQACTAAKRFIVLEEYYDEFVKQFADKMSKLTLWDPMEASTTAQVICQSSAVDEIERQVNTSISEWARCVTGWKKASINGKGFFYEPTVLADVTEEMTSYQEEVFWPVASVIKAKDVEEIIYHANAIDLGLWGCIFGDNHEELVEISSRVNTGMMFINQTLAWKAEIPFGWVKKSGYGKEWWADGLRAFVNKKVILY